MFASVYETRDEAWTWSEIVPDFKIKISPALRTPDGQLLVPGGVMSDNELHGSKDGGKTWGKLSKFALDQQLVVLPSGCLLALGTARHGLFSIRSSQDGGATWQAEYNNFDRVAYEATQNK